MASSIIGMCLTQAEERRCHIGPDDPHAQRGEKTPTTAAFFIAQKGVGFRIFHVTVLRLSNSVQSSADDARLPGIAVPVTGVDIFFPEACTLRRIE
jgi:hypothetical protein